MASLLSLSRRLELLELQAPKKPRIDTAEAQQQMLQRMQAYREARQAYEALSVPDKIKAKRQELQALRAIELASTDTLWSDKFMAYRVSMIETDIQELESVAPQIISNLRRAADAALGGRRLDADDLPIDREPGRSETASDFEAIAGGLVDCEPEYFSEPSPARKIMRVIEQDRLAGFRDDESMRRWEP